MKKKILEMKKENFAALTAGYLAGKLYPNFDYGMTREERQKREEMVTELMQDAADKMIDQIEWELNNGWHPTSRSLERLGQRIAEGMEEPDHDMLDAFIRERAMIDKLMYQKYEEDQALNQLICDIFEMEEVYVDINDHYEPIFFKEDL